MAYNAGASSGNLKLIQKQVASASSALTFTSGISGYDVYFLSFYSVLLSNSPANLSLQFSSDGGGTYITSGYDNEGIAVTSGGVVAQSGAGTPAGIILMTFSDPNTNLSPACGNLYMYNLGNNAVYKSSTLNQMGFLNTFGNTFLSMGCAIASTAVINSIKILTNVGTFSGTFKLYGVQN